MNTCVDCGATFKPEKYTTGYAEDREGKRYCYDCAAKHELADLESTGRGFVYVNAQTVKATKRGRTFDMTTHIDALTTWPGRILTERVQITNEWRSNFGDRRVAFRAVINGKLWSGIYYADAGDYARIRMLRKQQDDSKGIKRMKANA
jgi:hypothetical protein